MPLFLQNLLQRYNSGEQPLGEKDLLGYLDMALGLVSSLRTFFLLVLALAFLLLVGVTWILLRFTFRSMLSTTRTNKQTKNHKHFTE